MLANEFFDLPEDVKDAIFEIWIDLETTNEHDRERLIHAQTCPECMQDFRDRFEVFLKNNVLMSDVTKHMMN